MDQYERNIRDAARNHFKETGHTAKDEKDPKHIESWMDTKKLLSQTKDDLT